MKMKMKFMLPAAVGAAMSLGCAVHADTYEPYRPSESLSALDRRFTIDAALSDMTEIRFGWLAEKKANSEAVRRFGRQMRMEHAMSLDDLRTLAGMRGQELPDLMIDPKYRDDYKRLEGLSGADFDTAFIAQQIQQHSNAVALFRDEADNGLNSDVSNFATRHMSDINMHLSLIQALQANPAGAYRLSTGGWASDWKHMDSMSASSSSTK